MAFNGFLFNFAAQGWMLTMTAIGGLVLLLAWAIRLRGTEAARGPGKPDFSAFAVAVIVNPVGFFLLDQIADARHQAVFAGLITVSSVAIGLGCLLLCLRSLKGRDDAASKVLRMGARVLLVCAGVALLCMIAGVPGELETWKS